MSRVAVSSGVRYLSERVERVSGTTHDKLDKIVNKSKAGTNNGSGQLISRAGEQRKAPRRDNGGRGCELYIVSPTQYFNKKKEIL